MEARRESEPDFLTEANDDDEGEIGANNPKGVFSFRKGSFPVLSLRLRGFAPLR